MEVDGDFVLGRGLEHAIAVSATWARPWAALEVVETALVAAQLLRCDRRLIDAEIGSCAAPTACTVMPVPRCRAHSVRKPMPSLLHGGVALKEPVEIFGECFTDARFRGRGADLGRCRRSCRKP